MRLMTDCDVITHSIVKQTWHITTKGEAAGKYTTVGTVLSLSTAVPVPVHAEKSTVGTGTGTILKKYLGNGSWYR